MWTPKYLPSPNTAAVAHLVRSTRCIMKETHPEAKSQYKVRNFSKLVGCSPTHYERLEKGERELAKIKHLYGISSHLPLSLDLLIQLYLVLSNEEVDRHFTIRDKYKEKRSNGELLRHVRTEQIPYSIRDLAALGGISGTFYERIETGERTFKDIRAIYPIAKALNIPMYVIIRNELGLTDEDMKKVISSYQEI